MQASLPVPVSKSFAGRRPAAPTAFSTTVGGYTYNWTALQAAIDSDTEVDNGNFIIGNATDPSYPFAY